MATFPAGEHQPWVVPGNDRAPGPNMFLAGNYGTGVQFDLRLVNTSPGAALTWIVGWFESFLERLTERDAAQETTFLYLVFDDELRTEMSGKVHSHGSVQLLQFGCAPSGPPDGEEIPLRELVFAVIALLK